MGSNMASDDFLDVPESSGMDFRLSTSFWSNLAKNYFFDFFQFFLTVFSLFLAWKWRKAEGEKSQKLKFFENEALNQKSGSVKVLGYVSTFFDDYDDLRNSKLGMPPSPCFHPSKYCFLSRLMHCEAQYLIFE